MKKKKRRFFTNSNFYFVKELDNGELQIMNGTEIVKDSALLIWICGGKEMILKELTKKRLFKYDSYMKLVKRRIEYRTKHKLPL